MSVFADRLKELRGPESQASFAEQIGINRVQYFKYESGKNAPSIDVLTRICQIHACSADWLLGLDGTNSTGPDKAVCTDWCKRAQIAEEKLARVNSALKHALKGFEKLQEAIR